MQKTTIREYKSTDKDQMILCIEDFQEYERAIDKNKKPGKEISTMYLEYLLQRCKKDRGKIFVAEQDGGFAGYAAVWVENNDDEKISEPEIRLYFSDIYIKDKYRKQGIAKFFFDEVKRYGKLLGLSNVRICTLAKNLGIQELLKKENFSPYEIIWESELD